MGNRVRVAISDRRFELIAGDPALDLVNTLDWRFRASGAEELLTSYGDLIGFCEQSGVLTAKQVRSLRREVSASAGEKVLRAVRELREAASEFLYAELEGRKAAVATIVALEGIFKDARRHQRLRRGGATLQWDWPEGEVAADLPVWVLALRAEELMTSERIEALRECGNAECRWLFLDTSKNHTRRWCDMKVCGNRMKARRFKASHAAD
ncbi:MAG: CGNR zinc finger domain-containing protein [Terracidiphilus sp.]